MSEEDRPWRIGGNDYTEEAVRQAALAIRRDRIAKQRAMSLAQSNWLQRRVYLAYWALQDRFSHYHRVNR